MANASETLFVTLTTFDNAIEAHIVKGLLESEQIAVFLVGEHFFGAQFLLNVGLAHIRMQVCAVQLAKAKQLLADYKNGILEEPFAEAFSLRTNICKICGSDESEEISARPSQLIGGLVQMFFISLVLPPIKQKICKNCKSKVQEN